MTSRYLALPVLCLGLIACGRRAEQSPPAAPAAGAAAEAADTHGEENELRIEAGMLRDLRITTAAVESRRGGEQVSLLGELAVNESAYAEVGAPVASRVVRLMAGVGDHVDTGRPLLELQSTEVGRARADYLTAVARLTLAESALARKRELAAERIAPPREVQEADAAATAARADVRAAAAALHAMGVPVPEGPDTDARASFFRLASPIRGTVIERRAVQGQMLDPGTPAFRIADLALLWLTVHAFERDAVRVEQGSTARVSFAALPGRTFTGRVTLVGRQVSSESRTVDVRIAVANRDGVLRPGMSATASLPIWAGDTPILAVPVAAVQRVGDDWCVFVPRETGRFEIRRIGRGRDLGAEVEVLSGVRAGETVVVDGAFLLKSQAGKADSGHEDH